MFSFRTLLCICSSESSKPRRSGSSETTLDATHRLETLEHEAFPARARSKSIVRARVPRQRLSAIPEFHLPAPDNELGPGPFVQAPSSRLTLAPIPNPAPSPPRIHHVSATISPRMLTPFLKDGGFAQGGAERLPLHTFSADWGDEDADDGKSDDTGEAVYKFIYEGNGGVTWPLRKIRVDNRDVEGEEEDADFGEDRVHVIDAHEVVQSVEPISKDVRDTAGDSISLGQQALMLTSDEMQNAADDSAGYVQEARDTSRKYRIHVRASDAEPMTSPRFKVCVRSSKELENESMRRLPKRWAAILYEMQAAIEVADDQTKSDLEQRKDSAGIHEGVD